MEKTLFDDLVVSLKQAKAISTGKAPASHRTVVTAPDVKVIREAAGLSQTEFASLLKVSPKT